MTQSHIRGASVLAALLLSTAAQAQVTPEQVWQNWQDLSASYGQTITAESAVRAGDTLTVTGMQIDSEFDGGTVSGSIDMVAFRDLGDGTVEVTMSPEYPITIETLSDDAEDATIELLVKQPGLKLIAGGTESETSYDFSAPTAGVSVTGMTVEDKPFDLKLEMDLIGLAGKYIFSSVDKQKITSTVQADSAKLDIAVTDPDPANGGSMTFKGSMATLAGTTSGVLLDPEQMADMAKALADGFATEAAMTYGATDFAFGFTDTVSAETFASSGTLGGGSLNFGLDANRMQYGGGSKAVTVKASGSQIPFPEILAMAYADSTFDFLVPVSKSASPQPFKILTSITDLTVSDAIWGMFDPTAVLPRDPATVVIDTKGTANWLMDIFSDEAAAMETVPGEIHSLDITDLTLRLVGAAVTGTGAFTFDNTDLTTFDGIPAPTGALDLKIVGANGLLDKLIAMGMLPEDQAMGARMMLGLFARPGDGEDTLTSKLEFKDKGFFANGQKLQ